MSDDVVGIWLATVKSRLDDLAELIDVEIPTELLANDHPALKHGLRMLRNNVTSARQGVENAIEIRRLAREETEA